MNDSPTQGPNPKASVPRDRSAGTTPAAAVTVYGATDVGCVRSHNEDALTIAGPSSDSTVGPGAERTIFLTSSGLLLMVCDGMGGHAAGEVASRLASEVVAREIRDRGRPGYLPHPEAFRDDG